MENPRVGTVVIHVSTEGIRRVCETIVLLQMTIYNKLWH